PEIGEKQNQQTVNDQIKSRAFVQVLRNILKELHLELGAGSLKEPLRKHQNGLGKNHGHHTCKVNTQRHERSLAGVNLPTDRALSMLDRNFALGLSDRNNASHDSHEQKNHGYPM